MKNLPPFQTPEIVLRPNSNIVFVYVYTPNIQEYAQHSIRNITHYTNLHGYGFVVFNKPFLSSLPGCWNKVAAILQLLYSSYSFEYLVWVDADAVVTNPHISIESIIYSKDISNNISNNISKDNSKDNSKDTNLWICRDINEGHCVNSGVMIMKKTEWAKTLFGNVWISSLPKEHNDQNVLLCEILKEHSFTDCDSVNHPHVQILPETTFNSNIYHYYPKQFILHLMGTSMETRINIMRQINSMLGIDNYPMDECGKLLTLEESPITSLPNEDITKICLSY
jgi:hypothetical protein